MGWGYIINMEEPVIIYTDGSAYPNPNGEGGWAFYCSYLGLQAIRNGYVPNSTNNTMELEAVTRAMMYVPLGKAPLKIYTDSKYVKNALLEWVEGWRRSGWKNSQGKPVKNKEAIEKAYALLCEHRTVRDVSILWVKGHAGIVENEVCDQRASEARIDKSTNWTPQDVHTKITKTN